MRFQLQHSMDRYPHPKIFNTYDHFEVLEDAILFNLRASKQEALTGMTKPRWHIIPVPPDTNRFSFFGKLQQLIEERYLSTQNKREQQ